jgi:DNA-binding beta-propeller fold protein YncE
MLKRCFWFGLVLLLCAAPALAQGGGLLPYAWEAGDLALAYPAGWDAPLPVDAGGQLTLYLAQILAASPETRPPGIPFVTLTLVPDDGGDLNTTLTAALGAMSIPPGETRSSTLLGADSVRMTGSSPDGQFYGLAAAAPLPGGQTLVVSGRALFSQRDLFTGTFDAILNSLVLGAEAIPVTPEYGVLWHTGRDLGFGAEAFVDLVGAAYGPDNVLYTADATLGVVGFDTATGTVAAILPNEEFSAPTGIAVDAAGRVLVADTLCGCVLVLTPDGLWGDPLTGFGLDAPFSLAVTADGTAYATDQDETGILVRVFQGESTSTIRLDETVPSQPMLAASPAGSLVALADDGTVYTLENGQFTPGVTLDTGGLWVNAFAVDRSGYFLLATDGQGVVIYDPTGERTGSIGRIVANYPLPGEVVNPHGIVTGPDGTVYISDSDGTFGAVTAFSTQVGSGRMGATALIPGVSVQGMLDEATLYQDWTFAANAGQVATFSAVDTSRTDMLDVALRLFAPDGGEAAYSDGQDGQDLFGFYDAQIRAFTINTAGVYTVRVERVDGDGVYGLGITVDQGFELSAELATTLRGMLLDSLPVQRWVFQGKAGQVVTITMQTESGTLDPLLRLFDSGGMLLAENDDAADAALGKDAQLVQVRLPQDGSYILESARFDGEGEYNLVILVTS